MPCYMIQAGDLPIVKLGWTDRANVELRRSILQNGNHLTLRIIRVLECGPEVEKKLHHRFWAQNIRDEWFHLVPEMLTVTVEELEQHPQNKRAMSAERKAQIAAAMRKSWTNGSLRKNFDLQRSSRPNHHHAQHGGTTAAQR